ncbi:hypothetical protein [Mangrovicoccus sp. HB161399]|uniref:hypothetical protein n=1 Tax=Mangrovicoccus sp. HB161399 TaxID=2720392 RepID=UPI001551FD3A|nr:hypothetical protein [Mangrovicoccus sp. HB161399]
MLGRIGAFRWARLAIFFVRRFSSAGAVGLPGDVSMPPAAYAATSGVAGCGVLADGTRIRGGSGGNPVPDGRMAAIC